MLEVLRRQNLEGVLATVVRYYGGVKLGAGGLVRAYADCVAQALKHAQKTPIIKMHTLRCAVPYALEGMLRREVEAAGGVLQGVRHGAAVEFVFTLTETLTEALIAHLNEAGHGRISWLPESSDS